jgi:hypothetical protein
MAIGLGHIDKHAKITGGLFFSTAASSDDVVSAWIMRIYKQAHLQAINLIGRPLAAHEQMRCLGLKSRLHSEESVTFAFRLQNAHCMVKLYAWRSNKV